MKKLAWTLLPLALLSACDKGTQKPDPVAPAPSTAAQTGGVAAEPEAKPAIEVVPLQHASMILKWQELVIAVDPVQGALDAAPGEEPKADLVLVTDIHGDHFDAAAVAKLRKEGGLVVAPQAVADKGGEQLPDATLLGNGESKPFFDGRVTIEGVAMYNLQRKREESGEPYHVKGRGNGYVLTLGEQRVYISGDTECVPEMKALENIDVAFVCMNLPFTMTPEEASGCISEFKPKKLYPYHHRGQEPKKLDTLLAGVEGIEITYLDWYPASDNPTGEE